MTTSDRWCAALSGVWLLGWAQSAGSLEPAWSLLHDKNAPAWVQAIGSIMAILAAVWVAQDTARRSRHIALEIRNRDASARIEIAMHIANEARTLMNFAAASLRGTAHMNLGAGDFQSVREAIDALPFAELSSGRIVAELMTIRRLLGPIERLCDTFNHAGLSIDKQTRGSLDEEVDRRMAAFERSYEKLEGAVRAAIDRLNQSHSEPPPA